MQPTTFGSQIAKSKSKVRTFHNHISKGSTSNYSSEHGHAKAKCKGKLLITTVWWNGFLKDMFLLAHTYPMVKFIYVITMNSGLKKF